MRRVRGVAVLSLVCAALIITMQACTALGPLDEQPDLTGVVESNNLDYGSLQLASVVFRLGGGNEAIILTRNATVVQYADELGIWVPLNPRDIPVGASVRVWTDGVELRSDPPQYKAVRIEMPSARAP